MGLCDQRWRQASEAILSKGRLSPVIRVPIHIPALGLVLNTLSKRVMVPKLRPVPLHVERSKYDLASPAEFIDSKSHEFPPVEFKCGDTQAGSATTRGRRRMVEHHLAFLECSTLGIGTRRYVTNFEPV